jgi:hypothetical protein
MSDPYDPRLVRRAALQAAALCVLAVVAIMGCLWQGHQPAGEDRVAIAVGEVRSHSAEMAVLAIDAGRKVPPRFAHAHGQQLGKAVERTRDEVASLHPAAPLAAPVRDLNAPLQEIEAELRAVQRAGLPALAASAAHARQRTDRLRRVEQALQR